MQTQEQDLEGLQGRSRGPLAQRDLEWVDRGRVFSRDVTEKQPDSRIQAYSSCLDKRNKLEGLVRI